MSNKRNHSLIFLSKYPDYIRNPKHHSDVCSALFHDDYGKTAFCRIHIFKCNKTPPVFDIIDISKTGGVFHFYFSCLPSDGFCFSLPAQVLLSHVLLLPISSPFFTGDSKNPITTPSQSQNPPKKNASFFVIMSSSFADIWIKTISFSSAKLKSIL